ncbi:unnamed protein product [Fusarium graminearum]|uniref:Uncharacterized protein n=1 Tax=Gibberella zeae TaxID=5518 RepID=A0A4E9DDQ2_GIBZA|nr:unnamed protein product [Fusarium graminearum]CAG1990073.1 unnamed protein product [Fusarium graminearum]
MNGQAKLLNREVSGEQGSWEWTGGSLGPSQPGQRNVTRPVVKTVDVGRQRTAGGANAAVEVGTVPGSRAVQMLVGWMPAGFEVAVFLQL